MNTSRARRGIIALAAIAIAATTVVVTSQPATTQEAGQVRIVARKLESGRIEFALQQHTGAEWGERLLPSSRFFPSDATVGRWLSSTPLTIATSSTQAAADDWQITVTRCQTSDTTTVHVWWEYTTPIALTAASFDLYVGDDSELSHILGDGWASPGSDIGPGVYAGRDTVYLDVDAPDQIWCFVAWDTELTY